MVAKILAISAAIAFLAVAHAAAQSLDAQDDGYCQQIGAQHVLLGQTRSNDPYTAAGGRAGLAWLQQHIFDRLRQQEGCKASAWFSVEYFW
jgi:hypothetical protein